MQHTTAIVTFQLTKINSRNINIITRIQTLIHKLQIKHLHLVFQYNFI